MAKEWILNSAMNRFQLNFKRNVGPTSESIRWKCLIRFDTFRYGPQAKKRGMGESKGIRKRDGHCFSGTHRVDEGSFGRRTVKVVPFPTSLSTEIEPRWASTMLLTIERPRPVPIISRVSAVLTR